MIDRSKLESALAHFPRNARRGFSQPMQIVLEAAEAHRETLPKTKMVEVWRCEWVISWGGPDRLQLGCQSYWSRAEAEREAERLGPGAKCIRVTGPHQQEVPA